jgi:hypothetical protein
MNNTYAILALCVMSLFGVYTRALSADAPATTIT